MRLTPDILLRAYAAGLFPMASSRTAGTLDWYDPETRGVLPVSGFHVPRRLARRVRQGAYAVTFDRAFEAVIRACADARPDTWINDEIIALYTGLHAMGFGHSVETWRDGKLVGGLYGIAIGGAFFGESMFSTATDASKVALVHLVARLWRREFKLLDAQFVNPHLMQFGMQMLARAEYHARLAAAIKMQVKFDRDYSDSSKEDGMSSSFGGADGLTSAASSVPVSSAGTSGLAEDDVSSAASSAPAAGFAGASFFTAAADVLDVRLFLQAMTQTS